MEPSLSALPSAPQRWSKLLIGDEPLGDEEVAKARTSFAPSFT